MALQQLRNAEGEAAMAEQESRRTAAKLHDLQVQAVANAQVRRSSIIQGQSARLAINALPRPTAPRMSQRALAAAAHIFHARPEAAAAAAEGGDTDVCEAIRTLLAGGGVVQAAAPVEGSAVAT